MYFNCHAHLNKYVWNLHTTNSLLLLLLLLLLLFSEGKNIHVAVQNKQGQCKHELLQNAMFKYKSKYSF